MSSSSSDGDDASNSGKSDSLICGFGPRRSRRDSNSSNSDYFFLGAGDVDDDGNNDLVFSPRSSLICGFGGDGRNFAVSGGSGSSGDIEKDIDLFIDGNNNLAGDGAALALASTKNATRGNVQEMFPVRKNGNGPISINHSASSGLITTPITVLTKTEGNDGVGLRKVGSDGSLRHSSNSMGDHSSNSMGDLSIFSEDAIVMMLDAFEEVGKNDKFTDDEVCGKVYKGHRNNDYESIPVEVKIDSDDLESWTSQKRTSRVKSLFSRGDSGLSDTGGSGEASKEESLQSAMQSILKSQRNVSDSVTGLSQGTKQKSNTTYSAPMKQVSLSDRPTNGAERKGNNATKGRDQVVNKSAVSFQSASDNDTIGFSSESKRDNTTKGRDQDDSKSAVSFQTVSDKITVGFSSESKGNNAMKARDQVDSKSAVSFQTDKNIVGFSSAGNNSLQANRSVSFRQLGIIEEESNSHLCPINEEVSSSQTTTMSEASSIVASGIRSSADLMPIGEHAMSMARELNMGGVLDPPSRSKAPTKRSQKSKLKSEVREEGRRAVLSRSADIEYVKVVVPKPEPVTYLIRDAIAANVLFKACSNEELTELVQVFAPSEATAGCTIIREGDEGDAFYVMEKGTIDVYVGDEYKSTLYSGASFGEIALLYNCPRSATLRSRNFCKLWSISRTAFRAITSQFKQRRMEAKCEFLRKVKIKDKFLSDVLSESELNTLALATINESYEASHTIVREGDPGDIFYMIESGSVDVYKKEKGDFPVATLTSGHFFGELALLSTLVRTASCVANTDVVCHILMRDDFNLLLGDLQSLMDGADYRTREDEPSQPKSDLTLSTQVNLSDLDLLQTLGIGAFGRVRLAKLKHPVPGIKNHDGYFALKCISKQCLQDNGLDSHIQNEKAIMSELDHPFINRYYCDMEDDKYIYFLLEALPGGELCKRLHAEKVFPEPWGQFYSASVLFAFCHMHSKKIAYRDLKPENLVMDHIGYVKVVDFGLAKVIIGGKTWTLCGTPAYLAPEIVLNDGHDWSVDYWALGVFLFEMTSGKEPFAAKNPMEVYKKIVSGHVEIPPNFSSPLTDLIRKLLNTSKSKRLGRTMGGGGAVMQHNWYLDFDWDAHLEKRLEVPLRPRTQEVLGEDSVASVADSKDSPDPSPNARMSASQQSQSKVNKEVKGPVLPVNPPRLTYSLGQGNRHHQKLLEMMDSSGVEHDSERQVDTVRMTMLRVIKQHERWSKTSRESSGNSMSSTRNTSLNTGMKDMSTRSSMNTDGGASITSSALGDNDAFIRLQVMNLSLASKCLSQKSERDRAYQQFSLISLCTASLVRGKFEARSFGHRFLDPFVTKKFELIDQYASDISKTGIDAEALAAFCFPNGIRIRLVPRCAIEGAKRLGWIGENSDSYQIQGFTDVAGSLSHGCAITIREELKTNDTRAVLLAISLYRKMRRSARVVGRWWIKQHRRQRSQLKSRPMVTRAHSMVEKASNMKWGRKGSDKLVVSMNGLRRSKFRSTSLGDVAGTDTETSDDSGGEDECTTPPEHIRLLGQSAYQAMIDAEKEGDMCIVEKCYVLTGTRLQEQSLLFCALQNLINMERDLDDKAGRMSSLKRVGSNSKDQRIEGSQYSFVSESRHVVLSALQVKLSLTQMQRRIAYPRNELAHITTPPRRFVMDLSITGFDKISLPLPLPEVSGQWGLSTLFVRIKDSGLIILLKLLLLERSVLVVGETPEEVTACATALLELLEPYKWASAFMPLLPRDMLDFVSSPVPFIAGMIVESKHQLHSIIHDHGVKDAMLHGLSLVNLVSGKLIVTREQGTSDMLRRSFQTIPELSLYQRRLEEYWKSPSSNLRSFHAFFRYGASRNESLTLQKIKEVIKRHISQFTVGLADKPDAWQQYGEFNEAAGTFDFSPDKFIQPLKDRMIFQIQFQEMMAHTQLFVGYVEELQLSHEKRRDILSGPAAEFIAQWVELHWHANNFGSGT